MKKTNKKFISFLTIFTLLFVYISFSCSSIISFASENKGVTSYSISSSNYNSSSNKKNYSSKKYNTSKNKLPSSGTFNSSSKKYNSYTNDNTTTIKPDSGSFTTSPNSSNNSSGSSSTIKPDSGSFSTNPNNTHNNESNSKDNSGSYDDYDSRGGSYSGGSNWGGRLFRSYFNPYRTFRFYGGVSSWITTLVTIITLMIVLYIIVDYIRNRRD